jgi:hypothetical protein
MIERPEARTARPAIGLVGRLPRLRRAPWPGATLACALAVTALGPTGAEAAEPLRTSRTAVAPLAAGRSNPKIEPQVCSSCRPPLDYGGGPVLAANTTGGLTVTPIFWAPTGYEFPAGYERIIDGYVSNVAAASGTTDNVYSVDTEYYDKTNGAKTYVSYKITAGTPIDDGDAFPASGCTPASGYRACIKDEQLRTELAHLTSNRKLPTDLAHLYAVFFPPGVELMDRDGTTSAGDFCGYHRAFGSGTAQTVYANLPYNASSGCNAGQAPNGNLAADGAIDSLSHELNEAITDPLNPQFAWYDTQGNEMGDMCGSSYGKPLGSTNSSDPKGSEYNQVINGGKYYTQSEFSNLAFSKLGYGKGCALSEALAENPTAGGVGAQSTTIGLFNSDATPWTLPADGTSTSDIAIGIADPAGNNVVGDHVHFSVGVESGSGQCGALSSSDATTDDQGFAHVTYTASTSDVACWVLAVEALGGRSAESVIYQGTTEKASPSFKAAYPRTLEAGASPTTFTVVAANPSSKAVRDTRVDFIIFHAGKAPGINADQVHLSYSTTGPNGTFTTVPLKGTTSNNNAIQSFLGPPQGTTIAPHSTTTYTFRVGLASSVPASKTAGPLMSFEAYLDQVNSASGSGATLADTYAYDVKVPSKASHTNALRYLPIAIAIAALALIAALFWRRRGKQPPKQPPDPATS